MSKPLLAAALAACLTIGAPLFAHAEHPEGMHIHDIYARTNGGIGQSGAAFMMIHNNSDTDDRLVEVRSDVAERVELHTHRESADGVMQMVEIEGGIALPAREMHELARGGDHVMLMGLTRELADGDSFTLTFVFEQAGEVVMDVTVDNARKPADGAMDHGEGGHGHGHGSGHGSGHGG
ncbi:MAG: hypothetical protein RIR62_292 [Pseudomonadota bacterium]|jgi:copper(I)-binding protein